jgi:hypothetical protein
VGRGTRLAVAVAAASVALIALGAGRAEAFAEDSGTASVTFQSEGVQITCTIQGNSSVGYDPQDGFSNMFASTGLIKGPAACHRAFIFISAQAVYRREGEADVEQFGTSSPVSGVDAFASVKGVVVSMDVRHVAAFHCEQEPGDCFAEVTTSPK